MHTYDRILEQRTFNPDGKILQVRTIDMHTGGEPLRVILDGFPALKGSSVLEYRSYCRDNFAHLRKLLLFEPRGHADMYACILTPPDDKEGDFGVVFLHNEGYSTMCGHAVIALARLAVEMDWIEVKEGDNEIRIDAPCGRIVCYAEVIQGMVTAVRFHSVPSFVLGLDLSLEVPDLGMVTYDLAYGGAFYAFVDLRKNKLDFSLMPGHYQRLIDAGMSIKRAIQAGPTKVEHPFEQDLSFLYGTIFIDDSNKEGIHSRNVCVFAEGEVDRCPTGSGVSARMAIHQARKQISKGQSLKIESLTGSVFSGRVHDVVQYGPYPAVIPEVEGNAFITGMHTFVLDPNDPLHEGFILR